jgi:hypothetical protein
MMLFGQRPRHSDTGAANQRRCNISKMATPPTVITA